MKQHQITSGQNLEYVDPVTNEKFLPYCIEPSLGADRVALAFLCDAYDEEQLEKETRTVLHLSPVLAPFKAAVLPLQKQLVDKAQEVYDMLLKEHMVDFDVTGSIGKRLSPPGRDRHAVLHHGGFSTRWKPAPSPCATAIPCSRRAWRSVSSPRTSAI